MYFPSEYGSFGILCRTGKHYVPEPIPVPSDEALSTAVDPHGFVKKRYKKADAKRDDSIVDYRKGYFAMAADMMSTLSESSLDAIKQHARYQEFLETSDPLILWEMIVETHEGSEIGSQDQDFVTATANYYQLRQKATESTTLYKEKVDAALKGLKRVKAGVPSDRQQAAQYIAALDKGRYLDLQIALDNDEAKGIRSRPIDLAAAHHLAMMTKMVVKSQESGGGANSVPLAAVFAADVVTSVSAASGAGGSSGGGGAGKKKKQHEKKKKEAAKAGSDDEEDDAEGESPQASRGCWDCGGDHQARNCPNKSKAGGS